MTFAFIFNVWWAALGIGVGAVSVPVIIHLLNRRRFKIVTWAAMRFLLAAQRQNTRRMRIEQLLLLLVRAGLVALIVLAMASVMPWAEQLWASVLPEGMFGKITTRKQRVHHVFVLDASLSMNARVEGKPAFEHARQLVIERVKNCPTGDAFSVLLVKDTPVWIIGEASQDARKVVREVEELRPSHGNAALSSALGMVAAKLGELKARYPAQAVYFVTDLQTSTWESGSPTDIKREGENAPASGKLPYAEIQQLASTIFVDVGRDGLGNLSVADAAVDFSNRPPFVTTGTPVPIVATLQNFGKEPRKRVRVELLVGKARATTNDPTLSLRPIDQVVRDVPPGERVTIRFDKLRFDTPGTYALQVRAEGDALGPDDACSFVLTVKDTIPILLVNGKPAADRYERATEYLRLALNPFPPGRERRIFPLRPKVINQAEFADLADAELARYDAIYFCDVSHFGPGDLRRLETHLRRGGGVVFALGDQAARNLDVYNAQLFRDEHGLLPAKLFKKVQAPAEHHFYFHAEEEAYREPPLKAFSDEEDRNSLRFARFKAFVEAKVAEGKARIVLSFMPEVLNRAKVKEDTTLPKNAPALVEWNPPVPRTQQLDAPRNRDGSRRRLPPPRYRGKVALFTSTFNMDWTSWPGSPSFGALMQELARVAVSGRLREHAAPVGSILEEFLPGGGEVDAVIHFPEGPGAPRPRGVRTQLVEDVNVLRWLETDFSGIYRATLESTGREIPFAVNVPTTNLDQKGSESNLARADRAKLEALYPGWKIQVVREPAAADLSQGPVEVEPIVEREPAGPTIALLAVWIAFVLIFVEVLLAWQFGHYSAVEGATLPPATGLFWPIAVTVIAALLFLGGGLTWFFLRGMDPGGAVGYIRGLIEAWRDVPPPEAGEASAWRLDEIAFLPALLGRSDFWVFALLALGAVLIFFTYRAEAPTVSVVYKLLLGGLRLFLILLMLLVLLPQMSLKFDRVSWPDLVLLIDTSRSMGEPDVYQDPNVLERSRALGEVIRTRLREQLPTKIKTLQAELAAKTALLEKNPDARPEAEALADRLRYWEKQQDMLDSAKWRPSRLQLVQALLTRPETDWLSALVQKRKMKVHVFGLDAQGRAVKLTDSAGDAGEIIDPSDGKQIPRTRDAIAQLDPDGRESRLGTALRQVIDHYRGAALAGVVMFTDGVTTRDETIAQTGEYAAQKGVPLFFIGIGDDQQVRDLKLHDLQVEDNVYVGDRVNFEARLTGQGYKDLTVPVVLKVKQKNGKEKEVGREMVKVNPQGKSVKVHLRDQPKETGRRHYIIEVEAPKADAAEKPIPLSNLRLERTIDVIDTKLIRVLYVEAQPRYEFRYLKFLLERESLDKNKNKDRKRAFELKVFLLDADDDFHKQDETALSKEQFPTTLEQLNQYDVIILGDCDPRHKMLGDAWLRNLANFVRGEDEKGKRLSKSGGGLLMIAGAFHNPHSYRGTPLAGVMPIEPLGPSPREPDNRAERLRPELTPIGRVHPIFGFGIPDEGERLSVWSRLQPMYFFSTGYRLKPLAEVLAVHPTEKALARQPNQDERHPLVVQQFVGAGRCMFFGFDETWRWRLREDEARYNNFWMQTMRYLSRGRTSKTDLRLDRQTPYRLGEPIKVSVRFPDNVVGGRDEKKQAAPDVRVTVEYRPVIDGKEKAGEPEVQSVTLTKVEGSWGSYEGVLNRTREGKYRFRLISPDVAKSQPDGQKPSAEATVELPPGELERLRMNDPELRQAAEASLGQFYTIANADHALDDVPYPPPVLLSSSAEPLRLWNSWVVFGMVMFLLTAEWLLRKRKHLL